MKKYTMSFGASLDHRCEQGRVLGRFNVEIPTPDEESFFAACGVDYLPPEERHGRP